MKRVAAWRAVMPVGLLGVGLYLLVGCIPLPGNFRPPEGGPRPEDQIGKPGSDRPITLGRSTREDVIALLGPPDRVSSDGNSLVFKYQVVTDYLFYPLCFYADKHASTRLLRVTFRPTGELDSFQVAKDLAELGEVPQ
jgi:hypothetical protein